MAKLTKAQMAEIEAKKEEMREYLKPGTKVYTSLKHVSRSGMMRHISVFISQDEHIRDITRNVAKVLNEKRADDGGIKVSGCGSDMGFELIYNLGYALYPKGFNCAGKKCNSNDHFNGDRDYSPSKVHKDGGYALKQEWL
jgi:hypothetical protein